MPIISVIICAHNPRQEYLQQTLVALEMQTLERDCWELLLVDNASREPLAGYWRLEWHPQARHIREEEVGLTPARLRGIREARGQILVFVDDDNLLRRDYLEQALAISQSEPQLGAWGGRIEPRYEVPPPEWAASYLGMLAIREFSGDHRSRDYHDAVARPYGAGMVIRKSVAEAYVCRVESDRIRMRMDRRGGLLTSGGDEDLAMTAIDQGMSVGTFERLVVTHLIPKERLKEEYLLRLAEGIAFSWTVLRSIRGMLPPEPSLFRRCYLWARWIFLPRYERRFVAAQWRGLRAGRHSLRISNTG